MYMHNVYHQRVDKTLCIITHVFYILHLSVLCVRPLAVRTVLLAMIGFMPTEGVGAIGSLDCPPEERKRMARRSRDWTCTQCQIPNRNILPSMTEGDGTSQERAMAEAADIVTQMAFKV